MVPLLGAAPHLPHSNVGDIFINYEQICIHF